MYVLNDEQVAYILEDIRRNGIESEELQLDLLDHMCCVIETEMLPDNDFEEFYCGILPRFFKRELREIQEETILLLTFKNYYAMKKVMIYSGTFSAFTFIIGALFKVMHWPGAGIILVSSIVIFSLFFLPILSILRVKEQKKTKDKVVITIAAIFGVIICMATLFKVMHWPGANMMWITSLGILFFLFLPVYFFSGFRNPETKTNTVISSILILTAGGLLFTLTNLRSSRWTEETSLNSDTQLRSSYEYLSAENSSVYSQLDDSLRVKFEFQKKVTNLCSEIEKLKTSFAGQVGAEKISESELIRDYGSNYSASMDVLFDENGKAKPELKAIKSDLEELVNFIKTSFDFDSISILDTRDVYKFGDSTLGKVTWEEYNFSHLTLAMTLRNLNHLLLNIRIVESGILNN